MESVGGRKASKCKVVVRKEKVYLECKYDV